MPDRFMRDMVEATIWQLKKVPNNVKMYLDSAEATIANLLRESPGNRYNLANGAELSLIAGDKDLFNKRARLLESSIDDRSELKVLLSFLDWVNQPNNDPLIVINSFNHYKEKTGFKMLTWGFGEITPFLPKLLEEKAPVEIAINLIRSLCGLSFEESFLK